MTNLYNQIMPDEEWDRLTARQWREEYQRMGLLYVRAAMQALNAEELLRRVGIEKLKELVLPSSRFPAFPPAASDPPA